MQHMPSLKNAMTPFPYSVDADASVAEALAFMREHKIRHLPVTEDGQLTGLVSDRDIKLMLGPEFAYPDASELKVSDTMVADAYIVDIDTRLDAVLRHMAEQRLGSAIVTRKGKLVGVFTHTDACAAFAALLESEFQPPGHDAA